MSTRSNIAIVNDDGSVDYVYCHSDGYLSHNGSILLESYKDESKIRELIDLGYLSLLAPEIGEKHDFDDRNCDICRVYGRDRGEEGTGFRTKKDLDVYLDSDTEEYCYIFKDNVWYYRKGDNKTIELLTETACKEDY